MILPEFAARDCVPGSWNRPHFQGASSTVIGHSRRGRPLFGIVAGSGPVRISIVAGAHADEPVGPRMAIALAHAIDQCTEQWARNLARRATFWIVPHANPDGDADNAAWQTQPGDLTSYLRQVVREPPGDDVEFGYPRGPADTHCRPENAAIAAHLSSAGAPFHLHMSLHSMGLAEGAWFLIGQEWAERFMQSPAPRRLARISDQSGLGLHDMERRGEKGFHRLAPGFCTAPTSTAMRDHFLALGDPATAELFRPSSMEFVRSLGGDPLCLVSEIPNFLIGCARSSEATLDNRPYHEWLRLKPAIRLALESGDNAPLENARRRFDIRPVGWPTHMALQLEFLRAGLDLIESAPTAQQ